MEEITQHRFFLIYYPALLILTCLSSLFLASLNWNHSLGFLKMFFDTQQENNPQGTIVTMEVANA